MTEQLTLDEIRSTAHDIQGPTPVGTCRSEASELATTLSDQHPDADEAITVRQGYFRGHDGVAQHFYVRVEMAVIADVPDDSDPLVVDPTIQQFTHHKFVDGKADTYVVDDASQLPEIGVFTPEDEEYEWYE